MTTGQILNRSVSAFSRSQSFRDAKFASLFPFSLGVSRAFSCVLLGRCTLLQRGHGLAAWRNIEAVNML